MFLFYFLLFAKCLPFFRVMQFPVILWHFSPWKLLFWQSQHNILCTASTDTPVLIKQVSARVLSSQVNWSCVSVMNQQRAKISNKKEHHFECVPIYFTVDSSISFLCCRDYGVQVRRYSFINIWNSLFYSIWHGYCFSDIYYFCVSFNFLAVDCHILLGFLL